MNRPTAEIEQRQERRQTILLWALLGLVSYLLSFFFFGEMGLPHSLRMREVHEQLTEELFALQTQNNGLKRKIERLTHDAHYIESLARDQLGLVREGEWVYEFHDP
jgi:cell division protein FtsB